MTELGLPVSGKQIRVEHISRRKERTLGIGRFSRLKRTRAKRKKNAVT